MNNQSCMRRHVALLRGINQSGKNKILMSDLQQTFCDMGFAKVETILNSGNVLFSSASIDRNQMGHQITDMIRDSFGYEIPVSVVEIGYLKNVLDHAPAWWDTDDKSRYHNLIFILTEESPNDIRVIIGEPSEGKEQIEVFEDVIFWSYDLGCYQKCNWWKKTAAKGIAEKLTIRTGNTIKKICKLEGKSHEKVV